MNTIQCNFNNGVFSSFSTIDTILWFTFWCNCAYWYNQLKSFSTLYGKKSTFLPYRVKKHHSLHTKGTLLKFFLFRARNPTQILNTCTALEDIFSWCIQSPKSLPTPSSVWSKTTLITRSVVEAGASFHTSKVRFI